MKLRSYFFIFFIVFFVLVGGFFGYRHSVYLEELGGALYVDDGLYSADKIEELNRIDAASLGLVDSLSGGLYSGDSTDLGMEIFTLQQERARLLGVASNNVPFLFHDEGNTVGVVMFHGFTASPWEVSRLADFFYSHNVSVWGVLLDHHGTSPEALATAEYGDWLRVGRESFVGMKGLVDEVYILGVSMGGNVALSLAGEGGILEEEKGLVGVGERGDDSKLGELKGVISLSTPVYLKDKRVYISDIGKYVIHYSPAAAKTPEEVGHYYDKIPSAGVAEMMQLIDYMKSVLEFVSVPVLVIQSLEDPRVEVSSAEYIDDNTDRWKNTVYFHQNGPHVIISGDEKELVFNEILDFVKNGEE